MLSFGARKKYSVDWSEEEDEAFRLLESILDDGHVVAQTIIGAGELNKSQEELEEEEAFALLESILDGDDYNKHGLLRSDQQERLDLKEEAFELLEMTLEDDDKPIKREIIDRSRMEQQSQGIDPLEMERLEDAAFALLETILDDGDEPIDEDILFCRPNKLHQLQHLDSLEETHVLLDSTVQYGNELNRIDFSFSSIWLA